MESSTPPSYVWPDGTKDWYRDGYAHRDGDKPGSIGKNYCAWYKHGQYHRDGDKPAIIGGDGSMAWYSRGVYQRGLESDGAVRLWPTGQHRLTKFGKRSLRYVFVRLHLM